MALLSKEIDGGILGWVYVDSFTMTGVAAQAITLSHGYPVYKLYFHNIVLSADDQFVEFQFNVNGTAQTEATDYWYGYNQFDNIAGTEALTALGDESLEAIPLFGSTETASNENPGTDGTAISQGELTIIGLGSAEASYVKLTSTWQQGTAQLAHHGLVGGTLVSEVNDGITILVEGATTMSGSIYIMGLNVPTF